MEVWTLLASLMGTLAFCQGVLHTIFPARIRHSVVRYFGQYTSYFSPYCYFDITEIDGVGTNQLYNAAQTYLSLSPTIAAAATRLSLTRPLNSSSVTFGLSKDDTVVDTYRGVPIRWEHHVTPRQSQTFSWRPLPEEKRTLTLCLRKKDKSFILEHYLNHVVDSAAEINRKNKDRLLYTNPRGGSFDGRGLLWESVTFKHPSTFDTLAMDSAKKSEIMDDLRDFSDGESFYKKTGRAWKRGYLLHGPPGTGKSSMIAAMANFLGYDVYDLELTEVKKNTELRKLLMKTTPKSIIVIEDIDCSIDLGNREKNNKKNVKTVSDSASEEEDSPSTVTLSGLLNFTDGLWSACGNERIFVFTTNHLEKLDPALLRSGRMDMHIHMGFCTFPALMILLKNYLGIDRADLETATWERLAELIDEAQITPADAAELLIKNRRSNARAVHELSKQLRKRVEKKETTAEESEERAKLNADINEANPLGNVLST